MYRIAIIINENEVSHSKYADTLHTLESAMSACNENGKKMNSYNFITFDKFNIHTLFESGENYIMTFHGIIIATNALHNIEIFDALCEKKQYISDFINANKGIFISSQKKLSNNSLESPPDESKTGFMPELFDYYLFDRPEKLSKDGKVSICENNQENKILTHPYQITNEIIKYHCENNKFTVHRYRSVIIPKNLDSFITLLHDNDSDKISNEALGYKDDDRKLLLVSRHNKRIVISTMALDWASHSKLLCNILTFITEDKPPIVFVKKSSQQTQSSVLDSYIIRANTSNIPYRVITETDDYSTIIGNGLIFSSEWEAGEIESIYQSMLQNKDTYFSIYHISSTNDNSNMKLCKYCNFSSIDIMKDAVIQNIVSGYFKTKWNKSVWTYSYIINLIKFFECNIPNVIKEVYAESSKHFTKNNQLTGDYDGVVNATCKMLEILSYFEENYAINLFEKPYPILDVIESANSWLLNRINTNAVFDQDICYCLLYFFKHNLYDSLDSTIQQKLINSLHQLIAEIVRETWSSNIENRSSIDLVRIYQILCMCPEQVSINNKESDIEKIEKILKDRQDNYGNWKNINETAEIAGMLLEVYDYRIEINKGTDILNILIAKSIEILYCQFDTKTSMWANDLNTTAKAMYAIGLYDERFNFSINDFFGDLNNREIKDFSSGHIGIEGINNLYREINQSQKNEKSLKKEIIKGKKTLSRIRNLSLWILGLFLSLLFITISLFVILFVDYNDTLLKILEKWAGYFIAGFFSLVVASIGITIYSHLSKKIKKED